MKILGEDQLEQKDTIIEDGTYHARLSTRKVDTSKGSKLIITAEIIETVNSRDTGEPLTQTIQLDRWLNLVEKDGKEVIDDNYLLFPQMIAKALGHTEGEFSSEDMEGQVVKVKVEYSPGGVSKAGKSYEPSNRIKSVLPKDDSFEEAPY